MKVMLVNGSPRKTGSTNRGLEEVARTPKAEGVEAKIFWIGARPGAAPSSAAARSTAW